jgi:DNA polymerase III subunit beta
MKIECLLEKISSPLQVLSRSTSKLSTLPSLQGILLEAKNGKLVCTSTNLDIGVRFTLPVKVEAEGSVLVQGDLLAKVIQSIQPSEKNVLLELDGETLVISTDKSKVVLKTLIKEDFPPLPKIEGTNIDIQKNIFLSGLKSVSFATATTEIKPEIASVYIYGEPGQLVFVATDSFRLAEKKIKVKNNESFKILLPNKNTQEIIKLCDALGDNLRITYSGTMITIEDDFIYITARTVDGLFPDYQRIIPKEMLIETKVLKQDLQNILKLSTLFSDTFNQLTLDINEQDKKILCTTKNQNLGSVEQTIPAVITGGDIIMNFNYKYFQEVLPILDKESIVLSFTTNNKAVVLRQNNDDSFLYLIMPLNR